MGWLPGLEVMQYWCGVEGLGSEGLLRPRAGFPGFSGAHFPSDNGISEGARGRPQRWPGPRRSGTEHLKGKESRTEARRN